MRNEGCKGNLEKYKVVAVVGISRDPSKDSCRVAEYLKNHGFRIVQLTLLQMKF
ncbi:MAG: CoA-binding protein [Candidatus Bathyarchaeia archaeon]